MHQKPAFLMSLVPLLRDQYPHIRACEKEGGCEEGGGWGTRGH